MSFRQEQSTGMVSMRSSTSLSTFGLADHLSGFWLSGARLIWMVVVVLFLGVFALSVPIHFEELNSIHSHPTAYYLLSPTEAEALQSLNIPVTAYAVYLDFWALLLLTAFVGLGFLLFVRRSDSALTLLFSLTVITAGIVLNSSVGSLATRYPDWKRFVDFLRHVGIILGTLSFFIMPDGRFVPAWSRYFMIGWTIWAITAAFFPSGLETVIIIWGLLLGIGAQISRYRTALDEIQRRSLRLIMLSMAVTVLGFALYILLPDLFPQLNRGMPRVLFNLVGVPLLVVIPGLTLPLAIGITITRYRLWDIDAIFNRALLFSAVTGVIILIYILSVLVLQQIFQAVTGGAQSSVAVAISTVVITLLFQPILHRVRRLVTHRYYVRERLNKRASFTFQGEIESFLADVGRLTGKRLGTYEVGSLIGHGGMAEVYRARHTALKREVALKVLAPSLSMDGDNALRFEREAQTIAALQHPNIVQVFDAGEVEGVYYISMTLIGGPPLNHYLKEHGGKLSFEQSLEILKDVAAALDFAHTNGVIHRDVKPANVMLQPLTEASSKFPFRAILTDFGLARILVGASSKTQTGAMMGTLSYVAPEQIADPRNVTAAADIYALGMIAYQLTTGEVAFAGDNIGEVLMAHLQRPVPNPRDRAPELSPQAALAIQRALHKDPDQRFATAGEFVTGLG